MSRGRLVGSSDLVYEFEPNSVRPEGMVCVKAIIKIQTEIRPVAGQEKL